MAGAAGSERRGLADSAVDAWACRVRHAGTAGGTVAGVLECVINVSEGRDAAVVDAVAGRAGDHLLDVHRDGDHNRAVLTLAGPDVEDRAFGVVAEAVARIDLRTHTGVHPRLGAADVVPFVPLPGGGADAAAAAAVDLEEALAARDRLADRAARDLGLPCFLYGPERSLPEVRRRAFHDLSPDTGPRTPHPTAGASCVGARPVLVAYNVWLAPGATLDEARAIARDLRTPAVRALGLAAGGGVQVSCNLLDVSVTAPGAVFDAVARRAAVARAELVGLVPASVLDATPPHRWAELDLSPSSTIEARLEQAGLDGGSGEGRRR